jgi:hypothetical protein
MLVPVRRLSRWGAPMFGGRIHASVFPLDDFAARELAFFLLLLEEHDLMGAGALLPSLSFKDFHHAVGLRSPTSGHLQG